MPLARLAVTLGDPRGIGPEVVVAAVRRLRAAGENPDLLLVGPKGTPADELGLELLEVGAWSGTGDPATAGQLAARSIETAAQLALTGQIRGIVTAPIDKSALHAAGYSYPGHTEMLAALAGVDDVAMMMVAERTHFAAPLRVVLATTHVALAAVPKVLTADLLVRQGQLTAEGLRQQWMMGQPRLGLCAFNPHASDGGLFGDEEARILEPAIRTLRQLGETVAGPVPADTVFVRALRGEFDAVIAPYHDVGMAAFKTASFGLGVNVTLGLPFVRTSPDHGTALDIAGRGLADPSSMLEALRLAQSLADSRRAEP
jgi:4-hydroxythreonine-4-phosphate dehydrogenase